MPVFLLLLGVLTTVAGLVLVGSGLAIRDGTFDTEVLTPGTIAAVGGLLLIGLGLTVRELRRIERALAVRPMPRLDRNRETATATVEDAPEVAVRIPFPPKPKATPQPASAAAAASAATEDAAFERLRVKFPTLARVESGSVVESGDVSLTSQAPVRVEENVADLRSTAAVGRATNGAAGPAHVAPRLDAKLGARTSAGKAKVSVFNAFWPAPPRRDGQAVAAPIAAPAPPAFTEPEASASVPAVSDATSPVSVLKSGVVEGMAYTLYSDGSIEAQLPQGMLRFGSISALRSHIENNP